MSQPCGRPGELTSPTPYGPPPSPNSAAPSGITLHLREDRRHIQDRDLRSRETVTVKLNLEMACERAVCDIACQVKPDQVTLVPENRQEVTTEEGASTSSRPAISTTETIKRLHDAGMMVELLFLDADLKQIELGKQLGADAVELHTGCYALAKPARPRHRNS